MLVQRAGTGTPVGRVPLGEPGFKERIDYGEDFIGQYADRENMSEAETYAIADFTEDVPVSFEAVWVPASEPRELMTGEEWVYLRIAR